MNIYFSYYIDHGLWGGNLLKKIFPRTPEDIKFSWLDQAVRILRTSNPECKIKIITDHYGAESIKKLELAVDDVCKELNHLYDKYGKNIRDLGKIYSLKYIAEEKQPFVYFDHTFICSKSLEKSFEKRILLESVDYEPKYDIKSYNKNCKHKHLLENVQPERIYTTGIIGGSDYSFYSDFTSEALKIIKDPKNKNFWLKNDFKQNDRGDLAVNYLISCFIKKHNINPDLYFNNRIDHVSSFEKDSKKYNYNPRDRKWGDITGAMNSIKFHEKLNLFHHKNGRWPNKFEIWLMKNFV